DVATRFGADVERLVFPWGEAAAPEQLAERLAADKEHKIKAILITHNETSTGVTNNLAALARARGDHPALLIVDAVSSLGAVDLAMDDWGLDVVVTGSQKALMIPPGMGFLAMNERAWKAAAVSTMPKYYWDAAAAKKSLAKGQNPYTPAVSLLFGLDESLKMIAEEGLDNIFARHRQTAFLLRTGVKAMGLKLLAADAVASTSVTAILAPEELGGKKVQKTLRDRFGITIAGGQQQLENRVFRVGHLGYVAATDILLILAALEITLAGLGIQVSLGAGVRAAEQQLLEGWQ
ncbi:MAG TPA: alanine--glyoxylate aminotransferase family protein, partial [Negativicutes bacterium]|nr:alanine--glyoxylate aminotransferase family protein [Negativicutes bacterium]